MGLPEPPNIAEGDEILVHARVRKVWHDAVVIRVLTRNGSAQKWTQLSVPHTVVAGRDSALEAAPVPEIDWR